MVGEVKVNKILIIAKYLFVLWRNSQLSIKLFEREPPPQYRIVSKKMEQVQHKLDFYVLS